MDLCSLDQDWEGNKMQCVVVPPILSLPVLIWPPAHIAPLPATPLPMFPLPLLCHSAWNSPFPVHATPFVIVQAFPSAIGMPLQSALWHFCDG